MPVLAALVLLLVPALAGCGQGRFAVTAAAPEGRTQDTDTAQSNRDQGPQAAGAADTRTPEIGAKPTPTKQRVTLYFGDRQAMYLIPEEREVVKGEETLEAVIIRELIKGPQKPDSVRVMPEGTRLLSVSVVNGVAYVNFSKEFQTKHWGGSAGERMTIYSIVNSLCKLPGIGKVQFLLEGKKEEAILGHLDTSRTLAPNWDLVKR